MTINCDIYRWDTAEPVGHVWSSRPQISTTRWTSTTTPGISQPRQLVICTQVKWLTNWSVYFPETVLLSRPQFTWWMQIWQQVLINTRTKPAHLSHEYPCTVPPSPFINYSQLIITYPTEVEYSVDMDTAVMVWILYSRLCGTVEINTVVLGGIQTWLSFCLYVVRHRMLPLEHWDLAVWSLVSGLFLKTYHV